MYQNDRDIIIPKKPVMTVIGVGSGIITAGALQCKRSIDVKIGTKLSIEIPK